MSTLPLLALPGWIGVAVETALRRSLVKDILTTGGTADAHDARLVGRELERIPTHVLQILKDQGTKVVVARGSVTDHWTHLKGVQPRGWPPGMTWDSVPGGQSGGEVVIATVGHGTAAGAHVPANGEGHGSHNVVIHETFHAVDLGGSGGARSAGADFNTARTADFATLSAYQQQAGSAGQEETYAESAARYYGGDPNDATNHPNLNAYWAGDPLKPAPTP
jgi:insecticidal toxin complex protein TccC